MFDKLQYLCYNNNVAIPHTTYTIGTEMNTLKYPAPYRNWIRTSHGWSSIPWTPEAIAYAKTAGAWFRDGAHDLAKVEKKA